MVASYWNLSRYWLTGAFRWKEAETAFQWWLAAKRNEREADAMTQPDLFRDVCLGVDITGMTRRRDHHTSVDAAVVVARALTELHQRVLEAFREHGPMTDEALEQLDAFAGYGPSTLRKRRSELYQQRRLCVISEARNSRGRKMLVWGLQP